MSNVTGLTAEEVSQELTAIWNNFAEGSKNLEYYVDVLTKLGATTASSSSEISQGLEKFAAVANTVGLSYEYAASALATVTATTRQSADVVGNAFRTLFSRLEGLLLGETLEDGVDLNKYSKALAAVGVEILDANKLLKDMDTILEETASKWDTLDRALQTALATTIGGARLYATFIALMDKWDFMQKNLQTSYGASGTLLKLADIYAESWEAARNRVKASLESVYQDLLDDKFFITITNGLEKFITGIHSAISGLGGLKGVLLLIGTIMTLHYAKEMPRIINNLASNFLILTGAAARTKLEMLLLQENILSSQDFKGDKVFLTRLDIMQKITHMTSELTKKEKELSLSEKEAYQTKIEYVELLGESVAALLEDTIAIEKETKALIALSTVLLRPKEKLSSVPSEIEEEYRNYFGAEYGFTGPVEGIDSSETVARFKELEEQILVNQLKYEEYGLTLNKVGIKIEKFQEIQNKAFNNPKNTVALLAYQKELNKIGQAYYDAMLKNEKYLLALEKMSNVNTKSKDSVEQYINYLKNLGLITEEYANEQKLALLNGIDSEEVFNRVSQAIQNESNKTMEAVESADKLALQVGYTQGLLLAMGAAAAQVAENMSRTAATSEQINKLVLQSLLHSSTLSESYARMASTLMSLGMAINSIKNLGSIWSDEDTSTGEKLISTLTTLSPILMSLTSITRMFNKEKLASNALSLIGTKLSYSEAGGYVLVGEGAFAGATGVKALSIAVAELLLPLLAVTAALVVLVLLFKSIADNTPEAKLKLANEALEALKQATEDAKNAWEELKSSMGDYDSALEGLYKLKQGTEEFSDALLNVNEIAQNIIKEVGLAFGKDYKLGNLGEIIYTEAGQAKIDEFNKKLEEIYYNNLRGEAYLAGNAARAEANNIFDKEYDKAWNIENPNYAFGSTGKRIIIENLLNNPSLMREADLNDLNFLTKAALIAFAAPKDEDNPFAYDKDYLNRENFNITDLHDDYQDALKVAIEEIVSGAYNSTLESLDKANNEIKNLNYINSITTLTSSNEDFRKLGNGILLNKVIDTAYKTAYEEAYQNAQVEKDPLQLIKNLLDLDEDSKAYQEYKDLGKSGQEAAVRNILAMREVNDLAGNLAADLNKIQSRFSSDKVDVLSAILGGDTSKLGAKELQAFLESGASEEDLAALKDGLILLGDTSTKAADAVTNAINNIDWVLARLNDTIDSQTISSTISEIKKSFESLKLGDTIDPETYASLGEGFAQYFLLMEDGTYKLIGDAEEFYNKVMEEPRENILERISAILEKLQNNEATEIDALSVETSNYTEELRKLYEMYASTATSTKELDEMYKESKISLEAYTKALQGLDQLQDLASIDTDELKEYAKYLAETMNLSEEAAKVVAKSIMKMNSGIKKLADGLEDWSDILQNSADSSQEFFEALSDLREAMADLLDVNGEYLSKDFLTNKENLQLMAEAAEGSAEAIDTLKEKAAQSILVEVTTTNGIDDNVINELLEELTTLQSQIPEIEIGEINDKNFINSLQEIINKAGLTVDLANALFDTLGFETKFKTDYVHETTKVPVTETVEEELPPTYVTRTIGYDPSAGRPITYQQPLYRTRTYTRTVDYKTVDELVPVYAMTTDGSTPEIESITKKATGSANNYSSVNAGGGRSSGGGGGSSKPAVQQSTKSRDDVVDRYKEVDDSLKRMSEALDKVGDAQDRVWGANRIKSIENQNELLKDNIELLQKKRKEAEGYYEEDQKALQNAASALGWEIGFNGQGDVISYRGSMGDIFAQYHAIEAYWANPDNFSTSDEQNEYKELYVDPLWEKIDILKDKLAQYDETNQLIKDLDEELLSLLYQIQDNNAAILNYKLELHLQLNERERQQVDNAIAALGDDFFKRAEVFSFMLEKMGEYLKDPNIFNLDTSNYEFLVNSLNDWNTAFENGEVSQAAYVEGLESVMDASQSAFDDLISWNKEMADYYADTLSAMKDEIDVFTKLIDRLTDRLEHYKKVMELIGHETDYDAIDAILKGQELIAKNQYDISKKLFDDQKAIYEELLARLAEMDEEAAAAYYEAVVKPQKEYLDELEADAKAKLEKILELANAALENLQAKAKKTLELSLTNGMGFEVLNLSMNLASKYQDEYLTKTNLIYEINKLLNSLTLDMNKTNSAALKERIKNFAAEMEGLKNLTLLSLTELKIAQARYALLLALIALEDVRNAKSVVRLLRDSEGNFGYVYTADLDKIAEAELNFAERTNDLYNLALETTNDYTQKIIQLEQEMTEALAELEALRTQISKEEYQKRYLELVDKYTSIRNSYIESRNAGLYWLERTAAKDITEAWTTAYSENIASMENWKIYVEEWSSATQEAYEAWVNTVNPLVKDLADNENNLNNAIEETVKQSEALKDVLLGEDGVITRSEEIQNAIDAQTEAWVRLTNEISLLIERYQDLIKEISNAIAALTLADTYLSVESPGTYISDSSDYTGGDVDVPDNSGLGGGNGGGENQPLYGPGGYQESSEPEYKYVSAKLHVNKKTGVYSEHEKSEYEGMGSGYIKYYCALCKHDFIIENNYGWFDTGGYTGSWGPEGRFAMLHEKELVLDKDDTKNVLASVELVRLLSSAIDLRAAAAINPIGLQMPWYASNAQNIEQTVTIHAEFPNATDHTEILLALESLNNRALQYTSRR